MLTEDYILLRRLKLKIDLIPGPPHEDTLLYSHSIQVIARYPGQELAKSICDLPNTEIVTDGTRDPRAWQWVWRDGDRQLRMGFTIMGHATDTETAWGGSSIEIDCYVGDLLLFWAQLRRSHPDCWLHYDGRVYTPQGFIDRLREMLENQIITDIV